MDLNHEPTTNADLEAFEQRIDSRMEGRMDAFEQQLTDRVTDAVRHMETKLLQAFYFFAEINIERLV